ncbi:MAG TPA: hypothetical protein VLH18_02165 [Candidatus Limnocylindrales bacterium]|nr:hypothetical protein [Candidatus Limnocylindrales bacterium]
MHKLIDDFVFTLEIEDVLKGQGIDPARASERLFEGAEAVIEEALRIINPAAIYSTLDVVDFNHQRITFAGGFFEGPLVARSMAGAEQLSIALCTIGPHLDRRVTELMSENPIRAVALDGAGIAAIRKVALGVEEQICAEACELALELGMLTQPGQEGWPIEQQRQIFALLPADIIGVHLTENCLMIPKKTVSFVIPRGSKMNNTACSCDLCSKQERCQWRKDI